MSRWFRFYEKKRGDRRTVPQQFGSVGEALFFGFFLVVGCVAFWAMFTLLIVPEWRANRHFVETICTVRDKEIEIRDDDGLQYRPEIVIDYLADGRPMRDKSYDIHRSFTPNRELAQAQLDQFEIGQQYYGWYDPMEPGHCVLLRGYSGWLYLILLVPLSFIAIGGGRLVYTWLHWGTSAERRAVMTRRAAQIDLFDSAAAGELPNVPCDTNLTNSPGTRLAYRLPIGAAPGWALFVLVFACLLWNSIMLVFAAMAIRSHLVGKPDWALTLFMVPFLLLGLGLIAYVARQVMATTGVGATRVEISNHPLYPGKQYDVFVSQAGRIKMNSLRVFLVCEEKATYRQGTDTRTDTRQVFEQCLLTAEKFEIEDPRPFESECKLRVPAVTMHSFRSDHNEIAWKLLVRGDVDAPAWRAPDYEREFPIVVYPTPTPGADRDD